MEAPMPEKHTDRSYEQELAQIRSLVKRMGAEVTDMLSRSLRALRAGDASLARAVIGSDRRVNRLEVDVDELCMRVIARRQPVASDLRFIATTLKLDTDLERVGDLCVDICERILELGAPVSTEAGVRLDKMGEEVGAMVETALEAFLTGDVTLAERVLESDAAVDDAYRQLFEILLAGMRAGSRPSQDGVRLQAIGRYLERIGDHATNLAEMAIFYAQGRDVRHSGRVAERAPVAWIAGGARLAVDAASDAIAASTAAARNGRARAAR
jgi:phosphate transport system protein